jgi:hypothetical protein
MMQGKAVHLLLNLKNILAMLLAQTEADIEEAHLLGRRFIKVYRS